MKRNMLQGELGDKLNVMFAAIGFNLKKLMKGLKRLFFCLRIEIQNFGDFICTAVKILSAQINFNRVLAATTLCD